MKLELLFLTLLSAIATAAPLTQDGAPPMAKVRLLAFSRVGQDMEVNIVDPKGNSIAKKPVALPTQQLSPVENLTAKSLVFNSPKNPAKILGKVTLPAEGTEFLLVFLPAPDGAPAPYHVDVVSLPEKNFKSGDYAFVNYSGYAVGCDIEGERLLVPHGKSNIYHAGKSGKGPGNRSFVCYQRIDETWDPIPFSSIRIIIQDGVRNLVLICKDPRTGRIDFRGIPDFIAKN